jgi:hypothetical protein
MFSWSKGEKDVSETIMGTGPAEYEGVSSASYSKILIL